MGKKEKKVQIGQFEFRAGFEPSTFNEKRNTIDLVWTTGAKVFRSPFWGEPYYEELAVDESSIRMDRLNSGAPLLNNHSNWSLEDVIGVVESARIEDGKGIATVRLSQREEIAGLVGDIKAGIIRNVSVGYQVHKYEKVNAPEGTATAEIPTYRAIDWEPMELSFVGIPADAGAQSRSHAKLNECLIIENQKGEDMGKRNGVSTEETKPASLSPEETAGIAPVEASATTEGEQGSAPAEASAPSVEGERAAQSVDVQQVQQQEIERSTAIRQAVRAAKLEESFADDLVTKKVTVEQARAAVIAELEKKTATETTNIRIERGSMEPQLARREAATRILLNQYDGNKFKLENGDGEMRAHGILGMARKILSLEGVRNAYDLSPTEVATRALHHSSDFPLILENVANKSLQKAYEAAPNTYAPFVSQVNVSDFKQISSTKLSDGGKLEKLNEHGEIKRGSLVESGEKYQVETFAKIIGATRKLIINDDLNAFSKIPASLGMRARQKENEIFWAMIIANKVMAETGLSLFHANHKNLAAAGSLISIASLGAGRAAMKSLLDMDKQPIAISPSFLVVPTGLETMAEQFVAPIQANVNGSVNPFAGRLQVLSEPYLDGLVSGGIIPWFLFADAGKVPMGEMAKIDGQGPKISIREGFEIEGAETKIVYDFGMTLLDYRGFYKNPGLALP